MGDMITFTANGGTAGGYLATPEGGSGPGVIVIQEWWGLVGHIKDVADRFAAAGFFALAPDLYHGDQAKSPDDAGKLMMALNIGETAKELRGAASYLIALDGVSPKKVGAIGFCMGGALALFGACDSPDLIGACVDFYGVHPKATPDVARLSGPVLAHFGKKDKGVNPDVANALVRRIEDAGKDVQAHFYDAGHAFFNDQRPQAYNEAAARLAWKRTIDFLRATLT